MKHKSIKALIKRPAIMVAATLAVASAAALAMPAMALANSGSVTSNDGSGEVKKEFTDLDSLFSYVNGLKAITINISLSDDWDTSSYGCITVQQGKRYRFKLNGHMINRGKALSYDKETPWYAEGDGEVFKLRKGSSLNIDGGDQNTVHRGTLSDNGRFWKSDISGGEILYGGLITGGATDGSTYNDSNCGGGAIGSEEDGAAVVLSNVTLAGNLADTHGLFSMGGNGGAISMVGKGSYLTASGCKIIYNHAEGRGGAIYMGGKTSETSISGTKVEHNYSANNGGAISVEKKSNVSISNGSSISYNYAANSGGAFDSNDSRSTLSVDQSTFKGNVAKRNGGAVDAISAKVTFSASTISGNSASGDGGALHFWLYNFPVTIEKGTVISKNSAGDEGGGVYFDVNDRTLTISNSSITENTAKTDGGGIYHNGRNGTVVITDGSKISSNVAQTGSGGGIYNNWSGTSYKMSGKSSIGGNRAQGGGGGMYVNNKADISITEDSSISKNSASSGGGLCNDGSGTKISFASGGAIGSNSANSGGGIWSDKSLTVEGDGTGIGGIKGNNAGEGAGIKFTNELYLRNIAVSGNVSTKVGGGVYCGNTSFYNYEIAGTVIIDGNYSANDESNLVLLEGEQSVCGSDSNPLTVESRIGITALNYAGYIRVVVGNTAPYSALGENWSKVFSSDNKNLSLKEHLNKIYMDPNPSAYELVIYGRAGTALPSVWQQPGDKVKLETATFAKDGYTLDYWEVSGVDGVEKLEPKDGVAEFTMPKGKVTARAHYTQILDSLELMIDEPAAWDALGSNTSEATVSAFKLYAGKSDSYGVYTTDEMRKEIKVTSVAVEDKGEGKKGATYTASLSAKVLQSYGLCFDSASFKTAAFLVNTSFDSASTLEAKASADAQGNVTVTGTVELKAPADAVTVNAVNVNSKTSSIVVFDTVVQQVSDLMDVGGRSIVAASGDEAAQANETITISAPSEPGWKFSKWKTVPDDAVVDETTGSVTLFLSEAAGAKLEAVYEPLVSAVSITVAEPKPGEAFPTQIESIKVAGAVERDVTDEFKDLIKVNWTLSDGNPAGDVAQGDTMYRVTLNANAKDFSYIFGVDESFYTTVNGAEPFSCEYDNGSKTGSIRYYMTTAEDDSYDGILGEYPTGSVYSVSSVGADDLPAQVYYKLKSGAIKSAKVTWDTSGLDTTQESGTFSVPGTFVDEQGSTHEVSKTFAVIELGAPEATYAEKKGGKGTQTVKLGQGSMWEDNVNYTIYYKKFKANESYGLDSLDDFDKYEDGAAIDLGKDEIIMAYAKVNVASGVTKETAVEVYGRSLELADVKVASGVYSADGATPAVTVKLGKQTLVENEDYTLDYYDNTAVGEGCVIIEGTGFQYSGSVFMTYQINPTKVTGVAAKASGKKKVKVSWSKHKAQTDGFQVRYATSKAKLAKNKGKAVKVKGASAKSYTAKKLKSGKKYFFKVRAYKVVDGETYYSAWSKVKSTKAK